MLAIAALTYLAYDRLGRARGRGAVSELLIAKSRDVSRALDNVAAHRPWTSALLRAEIADPATDEHRRVRARLGLLPADPSQANPLLDVLLNENSDDFLVIRQSLRDLANRAELAERCRIVLKNDHEGPDRRLRAGLVLAGLLGDPGAADDGALREAAGVVADRFLADLRYHPARFDDGLAAIKPAGPLLIAPFESIFRDPDRSDTDRELAAAILTRLASGRKDVLTGLLLDSSVLQFPVIVRALAGLQGAVMPELVRLVADPGPSGMSAAARQSFVSRQANGAIALLYCEKQDTVWPLLRHRPDPLLRTYLIDRMSQLVPDASLIVERLEVEEDVSARRALILILGGIPPALRTSWWSRRRS